MFFIWYCLALFSEGTSIYPKAVSEIFGERHVGENTAILFTMDTLSGIAAPLILYVLLDRLHWYGLFFIMGGMSLLEFCLTIALSFL